MKHSVTSSTAQAEAISEIGALMGLAKHALLRPAQACAYLGISRTALHRLSENDPSFPRKLVISTRCVGFCTRSLDSWLVAKEAAK